MRVLIVLVVLLLALPAAARAQDVSDAAAALGSSEYVYVDPSAEAAGEIDATALDAGDPRQRRVGVRRRAAGERGRGRDARCDAGAPCTTRSASGAPTRC